LGKIANGKMVLLPIGNVIEELWSEIPTHYQGIEMDQFVIMPNHMHGIIVIVESRGLINQTPTWILMQNPAQTLGKIVRRFKAKASRIIHRNGYTDFKWQRNYHDRVIRNEKELNAVREYVLYNPLRWEYDRENSLSENYGIDHDMYFKDVLRISTT
jgi:REP element-mobilizing transposase RayT